MNLLNLRNFMFTTRSEGGFRMRISDGLRLLICILKFVVTDQFDCSPSEVLLLILS